MIPSNQSTSEWRTTMKDTWLWLVLRTLTQKQVQWDYSHTAISLSFSYLLSSSPSPLPYTRKTMAPWPEKVHVVKTSHLHVKALLMHRNGRRSEMMQPGITGQLCRRGVLIYSGQLPLPDLRPLILHNVLKVAWWMSRWNTRKSGWGTQFLPSCICHLSAYNQVIYWWMEVWLLS